MRAQLRGMYSADVAGLDLAEWRPEDGEYFSVLVGAFIGPDGPPHGEELFGFAVCTASWLAAHPPPKGFEFLRSTIRMAFWDYALVERAISDLCLHTEGETWAEIAEKLSRFGRWEFEDYRPS
jgi:hypothetical protein